MPTGRDLPDKEPTTAGAMCDLTVDELETVSGGCPCRFTTNCDCDKPSPRHP